MSASRDDALRRLSDALRDVAAEELPQVIEDARAGARVQATKLVEQALVDAIVERAAERPEPARPSARQAGTGWWVYGVVPAADAARIPAGVAGVEPATELECLEHGDLAALISPVPLGEYDDERIREHLNDLAWVERTARAHEAVLDAALAEATVVPLRLCTIYRDRGGVQEMLATDRGQLAEAVGRLRGRSEWGVKVFASRDRLAEAARADDGGEDGGGRSDAAQYMQRKRDERALEERLDRAVAACAQECHARLEEVAASARVNPLQRPEAHGREAAMVLNGVYLVADDERVAFRTAVDALRAEYEPLGFDLEQTGPWPAYNFVDPGAASER